MIINYIFNNFRSFYNDAEFSMTANAGKVLKRYPDNYSVVPGGLKLLKSAVMVRLLMANHTWDSLFSLHIMSFIWI